MSGNSFGRIFRLTTFGESHGSGLGGVVDGCPPGILLDEAFIQNELDKRKPGQGITSTKRQEADRINILSGVFEGRTTGTAIGFFIGNKDQRSQDYSFIKNVYRPGHADITYDLKYGHRDYRGGGRASARETTCRVAGGAVAKALLQTYNIEVTAPTMEFGGIIAPMTDPFGAADRPFYAPDENIISQWEKRAKTVKSQGESLGGIVKIIASGVPAGLGEPVFHKLDAMLAGALMSVGAVKGVEIGSGFHAAKSLGSENNDTILNPKGGEQGFASNCAGGILGGISTGQDIILQVAVKPIPSIAKKQKTITKTGETIAIPIGGRHDVSAISRINPVLEAMTMLVLADALLLQEK